MRSPGINGEGELRGQPANPGSPGKMAVRMECVHLLLVNIVTSLILANVSVCVSLCVCVSVCVCVSLCVWTETDAGSH